LFPSGRNPNLFLQDLRRLKHDAVSHDGLVSPGVGHLVALPAVRIAFAYRAELHYWAVSLVT
jgi:hypothetical protein